MNPPDRDGSSGSVDCNSLAATTQSGNDLEQTPNLGCSNGCREASQGLTDAVPDWHSLPPEVQLIVERWNEVPDHVRSAILTLAFAILNNEGGSVGRATD